MRLEKFLAESGIASRRNAKKSIRAGRVMVNGRQVFIPGAHIEPHRDQVKFDDKQIDGEPQRIYLMLNKPRGYITTIRDDRGRPTVMDLVCDTPERIYPVGRLDFNTEGLLLMTNDGAFTHKISHPSHEIKKTYIASVDGQLSCRTIQQLREGVEIKGAVTAPAVVIQTSRAKGVTQFKLVIHEGKKRQIRRMFHAVGRKVIYLKRVQIGSLSLGKLPVGKYRSLTLKEIEGLHT